MDALLLTRRRVLFATAGLALAGCRSTPRDEIAFSGETMGTTYTVKLAHHSLSEVQQHDLQAAVHAELAHVDQRMSLYRDDSELARFNRHFDANPFAMSSALFDVFQTAAQVSELSGGAFDITVAPLVDSWGFGPRKHQTVPTHASLAERARVVGQRALQLNVADRTVNKTQHSITADLGGIAKGYGVDVAARVIEAHGIRNFMIEAGGEVRTRGTNGQGRAWQIGIEAPDATPPRARYVVPLAGRAMATSGDYRIYYERDGTRYCHEIDPRRAAPIGHGLASVTVVADDCMRADALATALIVLGLEAGLALAETNGIAAYFIQREDNALRDRMTSAFAALGGQRLTGA